MRVLWQRGRASVAEVLEDLAEEAPLAYSTVATLLARMERKGVVRHTVEGRTYIYEPLVSEDKVGRSLVRDLLRRAFNGSPSQLVSYLLETGDVDRGELESIRNLISEHEPNGNGQAADGKRNERGGNTTGASEEA